MHSHITSSPTKSENLDNIGVTTANCPLLLATVIQWLLEVYNLVQLSLPCEKNCAYPPRVLWEADTYGTVQLQLHTRVIPHAWCTHVSAWTEK